MEEEDIRSCRKFPSTADTTRSRYDRQLGPARSRDWFTTSVHLLTGILEEWEHHHRAGSTSSIPSLPQHPSPVKKMQDPTHSISSPEDVAEAILNSIHCCVAAVGVSLGQDLRMPLLPRLPSHPEVYAAQGRQGSTERQLCRGEARHQESCPGASSDGDAATATLTLRVAQAFRRIGEVVSIAAGVEALGEPLCRRCFSLLTNASR